MSKWTIYKHVLVVLGAHVRVLTPIKNYHFNANIAWTSKMLNLVMMTFFNVHIEMAFVLTSTVQFNIWNNIHTPQCKVASLLWFAHWHENLWRCSIIESFPPSGSYKHSTHFPSEIDWDLIGQRSFWGIKHDIHVHHFLQFLWSRNPKGCSCRIPPSW